jgi:hypothetical protein
MWYFTIKQSDLSNKQYQQMQKYASLTEVEVFNEPYYNFCVFQITKETYKAVMDYLDVEGVSYSLTPDKPKRDDLLDSMK